MQRWPRAVLPLPAPIPPPGGLNPAPQPPGSLPPRQALRRCLHRRNRFVPWGGGPCPPCIAYPPVIDVTSSPEDGAEPERGSPPPPAQVGPGQGAVDGPQSDRAVPSCPVRSGAEPRGPWRDAPSRPHPRAAPSPPPPNRLAPGRTRTRAWPRAWSRCSCGGQPKARPASRCTWTRRSSPACGPTSARAWRSCMSASPGCGPLTAGVSPGFGAGPSRRTGSWPALGHTGCA